MFETQGTMTLLFLEIMKLDDTPSFNSLWFSVNKTSFGKGNITLKRNSLSFDRVLPSDNTVDEYDGEHWTFVDQPVCYSIFINDGFIVDTLEPMLQI